MFKTKLYQHEQIQKLKLLRLHQEKRKEFQRMEQQRSNQVYQHFNQQMQLFNQKIEHMKHRDVGHEQHLILLQKSQPDIQNEQKQQYRNNENVDLFKNENEKRMDTVTVSSSKNDKIHFDNILKENHLYKFKQTLLDNGIATIQDLGLISTQEELNLLIDQLKLPVIINKKFIRLCLKYANIEGL